MVGQIRYWGHHFGSLWWYILFIYLFISISCSVIIRRHISFTPLFFFTGDSSAHCVHTRFAFWPAGQCKSCWVTACERGIQAQFILSFMSTLRNGLLRADWLSRMYFCARSATTSGKLSISGHKARAVTATTGEFGPLMWSQHRNAFLTQLAWRMVG